jgi:hypothetical protein
MAVNSCDGVVTVLAGGTDMGASPREHMGPEQGAESTGTNGSGFATVAASTWTWLPQDA